MANKRISGDVNVEFNEAQSRQSLESGESVKTLFGKLRKWLTDLGTAAFTNSTDYAASSHNQAANTITAMTGYTKPQSTSAIAATDTLNEAIGKLEKGLDGAGTPNDGVLTIKQNGTTLGTFSANQAGNTTVNIQNEEPTYILGLRCDFENYTFTRLGDAVGLSGGSDFDDFPMYKRRRCNLDEFGRVSAYLGDDNYAEDGSNGNVYVEQPAFYYKITKTNSNSAGGSSYYKIFEYFISNKPLSGFKLHPAFIYNNSERKVIYESAYEGYLNNSTWQSIANVTPTTSTFSSATINNGETIELLSARRLLMIIEYGQMNMQDAIGYGNVNGSILKTGTLSHIGNGTYGTKENMTTAVQWRGIENPWGNVVKIIRNLFDVNSTASSYAYFLYKTFYKETQSEYRIYHRLANRVDNQYIRYFCATDDITGILFIPALTIDTGGDFEPGNSSLPVGDVAFVHVTLGYNTTQTNPVSYGGGVAYQERAGLFCLNSAGSSVNANVRIMVV